MTATGIEFLNGGFEKASWMPVACKLFNKSAQS